MKVAVIFSIVLLTSALWLSGQEKKANGPAEAEAGSSMITQIAAGSKTTAARVDAALEFAADGERRIDAWLMEGGDLSPERVEQLARFLDQDGRGEFVTGAALLRGKPEEQSGRLRAVAARLYSLSSDRLRKGQVDRDFSERVNLVAEMSLKELAPRLYEDLGFLPAFAWPDVWPQGWPTSGNCDLIGRGKIGVAARTVVGLDDRPSIEKMRISMEDPENRNARVFVWALGFSGRDEDFLWLRDFIERSPEGNLRQTAILSINRMQLTVARRNEGLDADSEALRRKSQGWHGLVQSKGWEKPLGLWD